MTGVTRPLTVLIAALGGEGGGVLMNWIVNAAIAKGFPVQATSIPGVAQRTGATTYYVELWPEKTPNDARPIFSLSPAIGEVDVMIATELAEGSRALSAGYITPDRTTLIGSTHRVYLTVEKMGMGDGRLDEKKLYSALKKNAQQAVMFDAADIAQRKGAIINAVMLGALAGSGALPLEPDVFTSAIKKEGKAVKANLAGFSAGLAMAKFGAAGLAVDTAKQNISNQTEQELENQVKTGFPPAVHEILLHGIRRLIDYQDAGYARDYMERLEPFREHDPVLLREVGRHLAIRMSYEDIIRVAQAKGRPARFNRIKGELGTAADDPFHVTEFLKPGIQEVCDLLPPTMARSLMSWGKNSGKLKTLHWGMEVRTTTITGYIKMKILAGLRWWRPHSYRWAVEQAAIERWLALVMQAASVNTALALEVTELARLIKGYGSTHQRGSNNYQRIVADLVMPLLADPPPDGPERVKSALEAALAGPDGKALNQILHSTNPPAPVVAQ